MKQAKDLQPGDRVIIGLHHLATVNAVRHLGDQVQVEWEEPYEHLYYDLNQQVREADDA